MEHVVLFTTLGPNPAPLAELLWALARQQQRLVVEAHVVVDRRGASFLERELLRPGGPLEELVELLGEGLAHGQAIHVHLARLADGSPVVDDEDPAHAEAYQTTVWNAARAAQQSAGERPLIFALAAGRRRTMVAELTMAFQMLARPQDSCLDVRVDNRMAEGGSGFFFPEQKARWLARPTGTHDAASVGILLVPVRLPRLGGMLSGDELTTPAQALEATQGAIDRAQLPSLLLDLDAGACLVGQTLLPLSPARLVWYAMLVLERRAGGDGWLYVGSDAVARHLKYFQKRPWFQPLELPDGLQDIVNGESADPKLAQDENFKSLRARTRSSVRKFCQAMPQHASLLVPETATRADPAGKKMSVQRIALPPGRIEVRDAGSVTLPRLSSPGFATSLGVSSNTEPP